MHRPFATRALLCLLGLLVVSSSASGQAERPPQQPALNPPTKAETDRTAILVRAAAPGPGGFVGDPYPLDVCIVGGEPFGAEAVTVILSNMVDPQQEGRHMRFCCPVCVEKFKAEPATYLRKLDEAILARFESAYPFDICIVMVGDKLVEEEVEVVIYGNRLYRLCCRRCVTNFTKQTGRYTQVYEKMIGAKQRSTYPLTTCVVTDAPLGAKPLDFVIGSRLVRVVDADAAKRFYDDPAMYLAKIDAAAKAARSEQ